MRKPGKEFIRKAGKQEIYFDLLMRWVFFSPAKRLIEKVNDCR
jgi:hypothetical protein